MAEAMDTNRPDLSQLRIHPEARKELERSGFIHTKHNTQLIEIAGRRRASTGERDVLAILRLEYIGGLISREEYEKRLIEAQKGS